MILIIDNYDSFTFNLVQLIAQHTKKYIVIRNDKVSVDEATKLQPNKMLLSPGPGRPEHAGICVDFIRTFGISIPILGICLGHQAIGYAFGARIIHAPELMHGKTSLIYHDHSNLFQNLPNPFIATRYHSLIISQKNFPTNLVITARTKEGLIMGIRHKNYPIEGLQFHPESILTKVGHQIIANWLNA